jgi:triosephosphate isomerase
MIVANWKMNGSKEEVGSWLRFVSSNISTNKEIPCVFCPPSCYLDYSSSLIKKISSPVKLGSQNINYSNDSALTGGINSQMLKDFLTEYVLIGHSEQRDYLNEDNESLQYKIKDALIKNISPIYCIGEPKNIKDQDQTIDYLQRQLRILDSIDSNQITIAYEPIWAIGTGENADKVYIEEVHSFIKEFCCQELNFKEKVSVVYGGSVKLTNCEDILSSREVDGLLIGGASLDPDTFSNIYNLS